jgi:hypothetical protein
MTYLLDHVHQFGFSGVLSEGAHDGSQFLRRDGTWKEQKESKLEHYWNRSYCHCATKRETEERHCGRLPGTCEAACVPGLGTVCSNSKSQLPARVVAPFSKKAATARTHVATSVRTAMTAHETQSPPRHYDKQCNALRQ